MKILSSIILPLSLMITLLQFSCKSPIEPDNTLPGRRDYTWTQDTLKVSAEEGYLSIIKMWASSPTDIWAVGWAYRNENCVWHYDGNGWKNVVVDRYISPFTVFGFAPNDVWIGGTDGAFWHYDGVKLSKNTEIQLEGFKLVSFAEIRGRNANDIYAVGRADSIDGFHSTGIIFHFDGGKWSKINTWIPNNNFFSIRFNPPSGNYIIISNEYYNQTVTAKVYRFDGKNLKQLFKGDGNLGLDNIGENVYITINGIIYKYEEDTLKIFKDFSHPGYLATVVYAGRIWGKSETDFFTGNQDWWIGHYNGSDLINIYKPGYTNLSDAVVFPNDVFFIGIDVYSRSNIIVHGKLKPQFWR